MSIFNRAMRWYDDFSMNAEDLYPGRYTREYCLELSLMAGEIEALKNEKSSIILAHNYLYPEFHEIADKVGDSLELALFVKKQRVKRVDFGGVFFMGETAKIIAGDDTRIFVQGSPDELGCSLVFGTDIEWIKRWKKVNPEGVLISYINSSVKVKALSDYISTSRNTDKIIVEASIKFPGRKILLLPDKFLAFVMKQKAVEQGVDPELIDVYQYKFNGYNATCHVHEAIGTFGLEETLSEHPDAELLIHPECGCASSCLFKASQGRIENEKSYFLSTGQMIEHAIKSSSKKFVVATEKGMVYALRKKIPDKEFIPVASHSECKYMKFNSFERLLASLRDNRYEIVLEDGDYEDEKVSKSEGIVRISRGVAKRALLGVERMIRVK